MHFGATLRLLRTSSGYSLRELAERIGVSNTYLSRVENGHDPPPTPDRLAVLADVFGLRRAKLIELADHVSPAAPNYLARVPVARELFLEIVRRELGPVDIARIRAFVEREFPLRANDSAARSVARMIATESVVPRLACDHVEDAIDVAVSRLVGPREAAKVSDEMHANERACSTALGGGLAVPFVRRPKATPAAVLVTLRSPLATSTPDGLPLRVLFVHTHRGGPEHTALLAALASLATDATTRAIAAARDAEGALAALAENLQ